MSSVLALNDNSVEPGMNLSNLAFRPIASVILAILVCLGISACQPIPPLTCKIDPPPKPEEKRTDKIVASIYVDATESMRGFAFQPTTRYARIMEAIEGAISTGWNAQFERYQFGTKVSNNIRESSFKPMQASFYKSGNTPGFEYNEINKAVSHSTRGKERLTIIITDLYQRDADINAIPQALSKEYLEDGYAVGIVAIKSEFNGTIYDVGSAKQEFYYKTINKPEKEYHPFYLIVLGNQANVEYFFRSLQQDAKAKQAKIDNSSTAKFVIFNPRFVKEIALLNLLNSKPVKPSKGRALERIPGGLRIGSTTIRVGENYKESVERLKVTNLTSEESSFNYEVDYTPFPYLPKISLPQPGVDNIKTSKFDSNKKEFVLNNHNLAQALKLSNWKNEKDQIQFSTSVDKSILKPGAYQFNVSVMAQRLENEPWWDEWNGTESIVTVKDGAKTYNLSPFLQRLKDTTFRVADKRVGQFCYAIQRE